MGSRYAKPGGPGRPSLVKLAFGSASTTTCNAGNIETQTTLSFGRDEALPSRGQL